MFGAMKAKFDGSVTAGLAYSVARLTDVSIDDLLAGALLSPRTCPHCGHLPDDFVDEETVVENRVSAYGVDRRGSVAQRPLRFGTWATNGGACKATSSSPAGGCNASTSWTLWPVSGVRDAGGLL